MNAANLEAKLAAFAEHGPPRTVAQFNDHADTGNPATAARRREI